MTTIILEVADDAKVAKLRQDPDLRIVREIQQPVAGEADSPLRWYGVLADTSAESWDKHLEQIRAEWERDAWSRD